MIGVITRVEADGLYVEIASVLPGAELGPIPGLVHRYIDTNTPDTDLGTGIMTTTTLLTAYLAGDRVLVIEDSLNDYIVLGVMG